jgi:hypothetical protein
MQSENPAQFLYDAKVKLEKLFEPERAAEAEIERVQKKLNSYWLVKIAETQAVLEGYTAGRDEALAKIAAATAVRDEARSKRETFEKKLNAAKAAAREAVAKAEAQHSSK